MRIPKSLRRLALVAATASVVAGLPATPAYAVDQPITDVSPTGALNNSTEKTVVLTVVPMYSAIAQVTLTRNADSEDTFNVDSDKVQLSGDQVTIRFSINRRNPGPWDITVIGLVASGANSSEVTSSCSSCFAVLAQPPTVTKAAGLVPTNANPIQVVAEGVPNNLTLTGTNFTDAVYCVAGDCAGKPTVTVSGGGLTLANAVDNPGNANAVKTPKKATATMMELTVSAATNAAPGLRDITVTNTDGKFGVCQKCLLVAPNLTSVTYPEAVSGTSAYGQGARNRTLRINGNSFAPGAVVSFTNPTGITINSTEFVSSTLLEVDVTLAEFGTTTAPSTANNNHQTKVVNPDGGRSSETGEGGPAQLKIDTGPKIASSSPIEGGRSEVVNFTITGENFATPANGGVDVVIPGVTVNSYNPLNTDKKIQFNATIGSGAAVGVHDVSVINSRNKGEYVCKGCFAIKNLQVNTITPADVLNDSSQQFTVSGSGFAPDAVPTLVKVGAGQGTVADIAAVPNSTSVNGAGTALTTTFPITGASPGEWAVRITNPTSNPGVGNCACLNIVAVAPDVTSVAPTSRGAGANDEPVVINGSGFLPGASVAFSNADVTLVGPPVITPTKITVLVDIASGGHDMPGDNLPTGPQVTVTNTDGQKDAVAFTVAEGPSVTSHDQANGRARGTTATVTISGQNFVSGATVEISGNGLTLGTPTVTPGVAPTDPDKIALSVAIAPDADLGDRDISVRNPDGGRATCTCKLKVNGVPTIATITPDKVAKGATTSVAIDGSGFLSSATVTATGITTTVTSSTPTKLTVSFNVPADATLGDRNVVVNNGDGGTATKVNGVEVITVPGAPTGAQATGGKGEATVTWTAPVSDGGEPITDYVVTSNPGGKTATVAGTATTAKVKDLTNGTSYTFTVVAKNAAGNSPSSTPSNAVVPADVPGAPTGVTATAGARQATVSWSAPVSNGGSGLTGYTVTSSPGGKTATVNGSTTQATVTGLTNGTEYTFTVVATNAVGDGPASAASNKVTPLSVPDAPTNVSAAGQNQAAYVTWNAPLDTGGTPILSYTVTSTPGGFTATTTDGDTTNATVTGLTNGTSYTFTVKATNAQGPSAASTPSPAVKPFTTPGAPTNVAAARGDAKAHVSWTAPASDNGSAISKYVVTSNPGNITKEVSGGTLETDVTGLTNGTKYTFTVTAVNEAGAGAASAPSNEVVPAGAPLAPASAFATAGHGAATVGWSAANGNGSPVTSYTVTATPGGATKVVNGNSTTFTGLTNGTAYTFTVKATNAIGTGPGKTTNAVVPTWVTTLTSSATSAITAGGTATVSGKLVRSNGSGIVGAPVRIYRRVAPATTYTYVRTVTTGTGGAWKTTFTLSKNTYFQAKYLGSAGHDAATSPARLTKVAYKVNAAYAISGRTVTAYGSISPNAAGRTVYLRLRNSDGSVVNLKTGTVASNGSYKLSRTLAPGTYTLYVYIAGSSTNTAGRSAYRPTTIR